MKLIFFLLLAGCLVSFMTPKYHPSNEDDLKEVAKTIPYALSAKANIPITGWTLLAPVLAEASIRGMAIEPYFKTAKVFPIWVVRLISLGAKIFVLSKKDSFDPSDHAGIYLAMIAMCVVLTLEARKVLNDQIQSTIVKVVVGTVGALYVLGAMIYIGVNLPMTYQLHGLIETLMGFFLYALIMAVPFIHVYGLDTRDNQCSK